jgi:hypothetical protein
MLRHPAGLNHKGDIQDAALQARVMREVIANAYLWTMLLAPVFESLPLTCPNCSADMCIVAFITDAPPVEQILTHIGEPAEPPPRVERRPCGTTDSILFRTGTRWHRRSPRTRSTKRCIGSASQLSAVRSQVPARRSLSIPPSRSARAPSVFGTTNLSPVHCPAIT